MPAPSPSNSFWARKQAHLSHCSDRVDDTPMLDDLSFVVDPDHVYGLQFEGFPVTRMLGMNPPSSVPRYVALIATLSPGMPSRWPFVVPGPAQDIGHAEQVISASWRR
jgi:hypothetical protein